MKDSEFVARVRRHRPSALLPHVAEFAASHQEPETWMRPGQRGIGAPWSLAEIARVSIAYGNEHRQGATPHDVRVCSSAYNELTDPELVTGYNGPIAGFFLRTTQQQLPFQLPPKNEMSRSIALFNHTKPTKPPQVLRPGWDQELFGTDLVSYIAAGELLHISAVPNAGRFNPEWLDQPNFQFLNEYIQPAALRSGLKNYVADASAIAAANGRPASSSWRRFGFNPLLSWPAVSGLHRDWLIPVPGLVIRRLSPLGIYYAGLKRWDKKFADDLGDLFENYIGNTLRIQENGTVEPAFTYDHDNKETIDFIVTFPEVVVLVEVKSVRPTEEVRTGGKGAADELRRMLGKGISQLELSDKLIRQQHEQFQHIPTDRPRVGVIVTMENFHVINSHFHTTMFRPEPSDLPITIASAGDIEHWVTVKNTTPGELVLQALDHRGDPADPALGFDLKKALENVALRSNPLIDAAWEAGPLQRLTSDYPANQSTLARQARSDG